MTIKNLDYNYAITIKHIERASQVTEDELAYIMMEYISRQKGIYVYHSIELDSKGRPHIHGHFMARKGIRYNLYKKKGYHIHVDPLPTTQDVQTWIEYIKKDDDDSIKYIMNLTREEYCFLDEQ